MATACCAIGCTHNEDIHKNFHFHRFPMKSRGLRQKWLKAIQRKGFVPNKHTKLCSAHFVEDDYTKGKLKGTAVPSIFDFSKIAPMEQVDIPEEPTIPLPEYILPESPHNPTNLHISPSPEPQVSFFDPVNTSEWQTLVQLGLDENQLEVYYEDSPLDEEKQLPHVIDFSSSYKGRGIETLPIKCHKCYKNNKNIKMLKKRLERRNKKIQEQQVLIASLKKEIADNKKQKIKIVGNSIILLNRNVIN